MIDNLLLENLEERVTCLEDTLNQMTQHLRTLLDANTSMSAANDRLADAVNDICRAQGVDFPDEIRPRH